MYFVYALPETCLVILSVLSSPLMSLNLNPA